MICQACRLNQTNTIEAPMCPECETDYLLLVRRIPETIDALQALADKQVTIGTTERGGNRAFAPFPLNETALRLVDSFKSWLQLADSDLSAVRGLKGPDHWQWHWRNLTVTPSEAATIPVAPQRYDTLKQLTSKAIRLLTPRETLEFAGNCPQCGQPIYTPTNHDNAECHTCGNIINVDANRAIARDQLMQMHLTTTPAGAAQWIKDQTGVTITRKAILMRIRRGTLNARPLEDGYYEIPISQLMDMVEEQNERKPNERTAAHGTGMA